MEERRVYFLNPVDAFSTQVPIHFPDYVEHGADIEPHVTLLHQPVSKLFHDWPKQWESKTLLRSFGKQSVKHKNLPKVEFVANGTVLMLLNNVK